MHGLATMVQATSSWEQSRQSYRCVCVAFFFPLPLPPRTVTQFVIRFKPDRTAEVSFIWNELSSFNITALWRSTRTFSVMLLFEMTNNNLSNAFPRYYRAQHIESAIFTGIIVIRGTRNLSHHKHIVLIDRFETHCRRSRSSSFFLLREWLIHDPRGKRAEQVPGDTGSNKH